MNDLFNTGPKPIPDCSNPRCGEKEGGNFGVPAPAKAGEIIQQAVTIFFCHSCWLLLPATQARYQQRLREAMEIE